MSDELEPVAKVAALDAYLAELDAELGPADEAERAEAAEWADGVFGASSQERSA